MKNLFTLCLIFWMNFNLSAKEKHEPIVQFSETYELANIILALTEYGQADKHEVTKNTKYYQEVLTYFAPFKDHPLLDSVNYSRKEWDKFLSFRTDAVAFDFDKKGKLRRTYKFYSMGKEINEFESHLALIDDFVAQSDFRTFFSGKISFLDSLTLLYEQSLMIDQIESFLDKEFYLKSKSTKRIIVSPLVGRMHCQRYFDNASTSFINIPNYLYGISDVQQIDRNDIASNLHMLFTEIDHDYVNPTTRTYKKIYQNTFDPQKWDKESGYVEWEYAVFNEYMTWAIYDVFLHKFYPEVAGSNIDEWHDVNFSRGFFASHVFGQKLVELYAKKAEDETIADLFPKMLAWTKEIEDDLIAPE